MSEIYFSIDIETDGPIPGRNSMLSLGAVALDAKGNELSTFTVNFAPVKGSSPDDDTMKWWSKQPAAVIEAARVNPQDPADAILRFGHWVRLTTTMQGHAKPVFVGHPVGFDFMFVHWYFIRFTGDSPFWFSTIDIESFAMAVLGCDYSTINKRMLAPFENKDLPHTHIALDDAREQGHLFINLLQFGRGSLRRPGSSP